MAIPGREVDERGETTRKARAGTWQKKRRTRKTVCCPETRKKFKK